MALSDKGLATADLLFNLLCITPLVQLYQYSIWSLCEFLPLHRKGNAWAIFFTATTLEIFLMLLQKALESHCDQVKSKFFLNLWYKIYVYVLSVVNATHAWSVWVLCELYGGTDLLIAMLCAITGTAALWCLCCGRNILGNPYGLERDSKPDFSAKTMFETSVDFSVKNVFDVIFTVVVIYSQIHILWFGLWTGLDRLVFPNDAWISMLTCIVTGYIVTVIFLQLQHRASEISHQFEKKSAKKTMIIFEDIFLFCATIFSVMLCKGLWMLFDFAQVWYPMITQGKNVTLWAYHFTSFAVLVGCQCSGSLLLRGIERDGIYSSGEGVKFSTNFFGVVYSSSEEPEEKEKAE